MAIFGGYWCIHVTFSLYWWGSFSTFDGTWWRDLGAHAVSGGMLLMSLHGVCGEPRANPGWRWLFEWFLFGRTYQRAALFAVAESVVWELFEWGVIERVRLHLPFSLAAPQDGWPDTLLDIAVAIPTAMLAMACIRTYEGRRATRAPSEDPALTAH